MADRRQSTMSIDLGDDQIKLERIEAMEGLSAPFTVMVDILAPLDVDLAPHLGKPCSLEVLEDEQSWRHFHGLVVSSEYIGRAEDMERYRLTLRPWTFYMAQNRDMAIFQDKETVDILKAIFEKNHISDTEFKLSRPRKTRVYTVQYRESDFAFISRLMEEEGIYYYFRHEAERHVMVLCDAPNSHSDGKPATLRFNPGSVSVFAVDSAARGDDGTYYLQSWVERVQSNGETAVVIHDYDFQSPNAPLQAKFTQDSKHPRDEREVFDYPGRFNYDGMAPGAQMAAGKERSKTLLQGLRAQRRVLTGTSQAAGIACGNKLSVEDCPSSRLDGSFLVISTFHSIASETYRSGSQNSEMEFNVRFEAIPADTPFSAPHSTPKPVVKGLETAEVTGPAGEEIYTDEFGRVKVRFPWDRSGSAGEKSTCWIRVSQTGGLGNLILPRVGHEVLVDFLGGDPDRPVVVGRVFNKSHMPVYPLPDNKTRALWRTKRYRDTGEYPETKTPDSGMPGANEIRFEDKGGSEEVFIHAERDMNRRVRYDDTLQVGHDQSLLIGRSRKEEVIKDETITIGNDRTEKVGHDEIIKIGNNRTEEVGSNEDVTIGNNQTLTVGNNSSATIGSNESITVGNTFKVEAGSKIELIVGGSKITIDMTSITLSAPMIKIEAQMTAEMSSTMTKVEGSAMTTVKGAIVMIN